MVVWMQSMLYSSVVCRRCELVYLCWDTTNFDTYKPNVCLIIPEKNCLSPSQYIRHTTKILITCQHHLTNMFVVIIQHVQIKLVLADRCMPYTFLQFVFIHLFGYVNRHSGYLGVPYVHIYWRTHNVYESNSKMFALWENTLFHYFVYFVISNRSMRWRALRPGCALTYVDIYEWHICMTHIL